MAVETHQVSLTSQGHSEVIDITPQVADRLAEGRVRNGVVTLFVVGSTAALTTTEYEPGLANIDLKALYERLAPEDGDYAHEATWNDDNGHSHCRATLTGPSLTIPLVDGKLTLGTWQQIILLDFDTRPRQREVIVQVLGE